MIWVSWLSEVTRFTRQILSSKIDLTGKNPNVLYELGLCHGNNREVILLTQSIDDVPFDLQHWRCIVYDQSIAGAKTLKSALQKMFIEDSSYVHVPVALLTEKFKEGFRVLTMATDVHLSGTYGSFASFEERWSIAPSRPSVRKEFIRKIHTSGSLQNITCDGCDIQMRKFMEGVFLLTLIPHPPSGTDNIVSYQLKYDITDGFAPSEEFWTFDFDCFTERFQFTFHFADECAPERFHTQQKSRGENSLCTHVQKDNDYEIVGSQTQSGNSLVFKWNWR